MVYYRVGYCPPNPGPWSRAYDFVRCDPLNSKFFPEFIEYAKKHPTAPIYRKRHYGAKYIETTIEKMIEEYETYKQQNHDEG